MKFLQFNIKPHSYYLLMMFISIHLYVFVGLPFFMDDRKLQRPKIVLAGEIITLSIVSYYLILSVVCFIYFTFINNILNAIHQFYLKNMKYASLITLLTQVIFYITVACTTSRITWSHVLIWIIRMTIILAIVYFLFKQSHELLNVQKEEIEKALNNEASEDESSQQEIESNSKNEIKIETKDKSKLK